MYFVNATLALLLVLWVPFEHTADDFPGLDDIPARFLRDAADIIAPTITFIVNLSLENGIFPSDKKVS